MRWVGLVVGGVVAVGCGGAIHSDKPPPVTGHDGGVGVGSLADAGVADGGQGDLGGSGDARAERGGAVDARPADAATGPASADAGDAGPPPPFCPPLAASAAVDRQNEAWTTPTTVPFSCARMPNAFFFPRPGADVTAPYARCASFADARAISLAVSRDGSRVALIGIDGIARIVDVASRTVVGVLAPPRASVGLAAFSPSGDTILTVARGERVATLWRADTFAPIWTTSLPGHLYEDEYPGAAAFSPDGATVLVSPGAPLYLLEIATGRILAANDQLGGVILDARYGWQGRRIAALVSPLSGMCVYGPVGGSVSIVDPDTLVPIAKPMIWPQTSDETPGPGQLLVAADADLMVTTAVEAYPAPPPNAFRLSDGGPVPTPALAKFPLALSPDGTTALMAGAGTLDLVRLSDGASIASTAAAAPTAVAFSADGSTVAAGSSGDDLLGTWRPAGGSLVPTCAADARVSDEGAVSTSLSADGETIAVDWGTQIRVLRRGDGSTVSTIDHQHQLAFPELLSPDGRYLIAAFWAPTPTTPQYPLAVFRTFDGAQVADLGDEYSFQGGRWYSFAFQPDALRLFGGLGTNTGGGIMQIDLQTGAVAPKPLVDSSPGLMGLSGDCLLLLGANATLVRSCGSCQPLPVARNTNHGVVSQDGASYLSPDGDTEVTGTVLWNIAAAPGVIRAYPPRPEEAMWQVSETPVAVSTHGGRVITGAFENTPCSWAPGFTSRVHDVATDTLIDELPPRPTSSSADLAVIAYGPVLWCAR